MKQHVYNRLMRRLDLMPPAEAPPKELRYKRRSLEERMLDKIEFGPGCWEWTGSKLPEGYGVISNGGETGTSSKLLAHREMYRLWYWAELPKGRGMHVMHSCDNPGCVRPDHLSLGTAKQNHDDAIAKGRKIIGV